MVFQKNTRRILTAALALLGMSAFTAAAKADPILYQSATDRYVGNADPVESGRYAGAVFTLDQAASITGIGAQFVDTASGTIFGVIVPVGSGDTSPSFLPSEIARTGNYVAGTDVVFSVGPQLRGAPIIAGAPVVDYEALLPRAVTLQAGTYAVIFGSGAFGASGFADIGFNNIPTSGADIISDNENIYGDRWNTFNDEGAELFVDGTLAAAVPEPSALAAMIAGLIGLGFILYRRKGAMGAPRAA